ncbi:glycosyltransferase [Flavihumibacter sp. ZG627]|uniref:glycosyltransferase n=1 Tax=Flavihumibacter sp. ZG627 TaxID=1463156 RepID=UPI00057F49A5|nr:glycosyltransferase [Flavihumibacter sp. ZG627]KIC92308.1 hypothetical protein HY58_01855 [Flavihumibacter sp. ZG627]
MEAVAGKGVSVILCCHNSAHRLAKTLDALAKQEVEPHIAWELIIVDNASTDNTATEARRLWEMTGNPQKIEIVQEKKPGLMYARTKGIRESNYDYLLFCDDDTWFCPVYISVIFQALESDQHIAACGGEGIPVFESKKPAWFDDYQEAFAIGHQDHEPEGTGIFQLYGAGMGMRKTIYQKLMDSGHETYFRGRTGKKLSSSEDTELTNAFVLMGYRLIYLPSIHFYHYMPSGRLTREYLKNLFHAFGTDGPVRNLYYSHLSKRPFHRRLSNWNFHLTLSLYRTVKYLAKPPKKNGRSIYFHWNKAYITELFRIRKKYAVLNNNIERLKSLRSNS